MGTFKAKRAAHGEDEAVRLDSSMDARSATMESAFYEAVRRCETNVT
jgi:hypothetical protein